MKDTPPSSPSQDPANAEIPARDRADGPGAREGQARAAGMPLWVLALSTTLGMQTVASFLDQSLPVIAPLLTAGAGL